jgi:hypothetical protein
MNSILPAGRRLQLGTYWVPLWTFNAFPDTDYDYRLMTLALEQSSLGGVAYSMQGDPGVVCNDFNFLDTGFCTLWKAYGANGACTPGEVEACGLCGVRTCAASVCGCRARACSSAPCARAGVPGKLADRASADHQADFAGEAADGTNSPSRLARRARRPMVWQAVRVSAVSSFSVTPNARRIFGLVRSTTTRPRAVALPKRRRISNGSISHGLRSRRRRSSRLFLKIPRRSRGMVKTT